MTHQERPTRQRLRRWPRLLPLTLVILASTLSGWIWWAEHHPDKERALRVLAQQQLEAWLPDAMGTDQDGWHGLQHHGANPHPSAGRVLLVHGLDEPGSIWDALIPALQSDAYDVWELRYPNDQGIDRSAAFLAGEWPRLTAESPVFLIGHSMGGLVIRDFLTRWRYPAGEAPRVAGAEVGGAILVGTPNHGSEWARLRIWLELREHFALNEHRRFSLLASLRDGTGAAKIDLRPDSELLKHLNARPWPAQIPLQLIGGRLVEPTREMTDSLAAIATHTGSKGLQEGLSDWWSTLGDDLGDGVVALASLRLPEAPPPILVNASHRGMLTRLMPSDALPPAIPIILEILQQWRPDAPDAPETAPVH
ncbi:esterase/lipase family protein [Thiocystis violacea]|uniref:esterase/lipase family protein n=1 Tax=Thiocystis violacea TaxID=13725 RepID=UPI001906CD94|nr:alpha/beta hydrolase [Thiocystis violacea]MBK1721940.1 lecithin--cholesterol acyltransferase [Thiocystis violacea]